MYRYYKTDNARQILHDRYYKTIHTGFSVQFLHYSPLKRSVSSHLVLQLGVRISEADNCSVPFWRLPYKRNSFIHLLFHTRQNHPVLLRVFILSLTVVSFESVGMHNNSFPQVLHMLDAVYYTPQSPRCTYCHSQFLEGGPVYLSPPTALVAQLTEAEVVHKTWVLVISWICISHNGCTNL